MSKPIIRYLRFQSPNPTAMPQVNRDDALAAAAINEDAQFAQMLLVAMQRWDRRHGACVKDVLGVVVPESHRRLAAGSASPRRHLAFGVGRSWQVLQSGFIGDAARAVAHDAHQTVGPLPGGAPRIPSKGGCPPMGEDSRIRFGNHGVLAGYAPVTEAPMKSKQLEAINLRLDFLSMVLSVLARSLPPLEAAGAVQVIGGRIIEQLGRNPAQAAEEAVASDLAPILAALQQR